MISFNFYILFLINSLSLQVQKQKYKFTGALYQYSIFGFMIFLKILRKDNHSC